MYDAPKEGQPIRYTGQVLSLLGKTGTFCWLRDYDLYCGAELDWTPGFALADGSAEYVELSEIELI